MSESDDTPQLVCTRAGRSSKVNVGVRISGRIVATFPKVDVVDPAAREKLADTLCAQFPGLERQNVLDELTTSAAIVLEPCTASKPKQADLLIECATDVELFRDGDEPYATIPVASHVETHPVGSKRFKIWLTDQFYQRHSSAPNSEAIQTSLNVFRAQAYRGPSHIVHIRTAKHGVSIVLDLADDDWRVVVIDSTGWRVVDRSPVKFRRPKGMLALPAPVTGGSLDELRGLLNPALSDDAWTLTLAWLVAALSPDGPYPVLKTTGDHGGAKSTYNRFLRNLVDPNKAPLRAVPGDGRDLMIMASNSWVQLFDNVSYLAPWLSDSLCRLATGGGFSTRELYSDLDEVIFDAKRPIILNGIEAFVTRSDLADRCIGMHLPEIPEDQRRPESELDPLFEEARPRILGSLLDAESIAIRRLPDVRLRILPRMADFARLGIAAEPALGLPHGAFMAAYAENREVAHEEAIDLSVIGYPLRALLAHRSEWSGTAGELLVALDELVNEATKKVKDWPRKARGMSSALRRLAPNLRATGWHVALPDKGTGRSKRRVIVLRPPAADHCPGDADRCPTDEPHQWSARDATACAGVQQDSAAADDAVHAAHHEPTLSGPDDVEELEL